MMRPARVLVVLALPGLLGSPTSTEAQDWPMARRDPERTALQILPGDIDIPAVKYAIPLGGAPSDWLVEDVDLDGQAEAILLRGGRAVARRFDGTLVWASGPFGLDSLRAIADIDGDGRPEVYAGSSLQGLFVLDGRTGAVIWRPEWLPEQRLGDVFPIDADADGRLELYVTECRPGGRGTGRVYFYDGVTRAPTSHVPLDLSAHGYWCGRNQSAGDLDGDGLPEIVTLSDDRVIAYDPRTGAVRWQSASVGRFPYARGSITTRDLDADGAAEVVVTSNDGTAGVETSRRLLLLHLDEGELRVRWSRVFDPTGGLHVFVRDPIADVIPGGLPEIVTSAYDSSDGWSVLVIPGNASGSDEPAVEIPGRMLVALADVTGDGRTEIVTLDAITASLPSFGTLRALRLEAGPPPTVEEVWRHDGANVLLEPMPFGAAPRPLSVEGAGILLRRDGDGDGRPDVLFTSEDGGATRSPGASSVSARTTDTPGALAVALADGHVELLDTGFRLVNDAGGGTAALREQSHLAPGLIVGSAASGPVLVTTDGEQALVAVRWAGGTTLPVWRRDDLVTGGGPVPPSFVWLSDGRVLFHARRPDGALDLVLVDGSTGTAEATPFRIASSSLVAPLGAPFALDGGRLLQATYHGQTATIDYLLVDVAAGTASNPGLGRPLRASFDRPPSRYDVGADGTVDVIVPQGNRLTVVDGVSAAPVDDVMVERPGGVAHAIDLDEDGTVDVLYGGGFGMQRLSPDLAAEWSFDLTIRHRWPGLATTSDGVRIAAVRTETPLLTILDGADGTVVTRTVLAGGRAFATLDEAASSGEGVGVLTDPIALADLTGTGEPGFVLGSTDGHLYALAADDGALLWSLPLRTAMGAPIAADFDDDGSTDILVPASDGHVYVVGRATLEPPEAVYDTDGTFVAAGPEDDLDVLESATTVGASWPAVPGATHYSYQILREDGVVVVPWTEVGPETRFARTDLALQRGRRYLTLVRAHDRSGARPRVSAEAASDGFVVADVDPPEVAVTAVPSVIWLHAGTSLPGVTAVEAVFRDDVALDSYRLYIVDAGGAEVRELAAGLTAGTEQTVSRDWDGTRSDGELVVAGRYVVLAEAADAEGRMGRASAPVTVCAAGADALAECLPPADAGPAGDGGPRDTGPAGPWQVRGGGCQCAAASGSPLPSGRPLALVFVWLIHRARSRAGRR